MRLSTALLCVLVLPGCRAPDADAVPPPEPAPRVRTTVAQPAMAQGASLSGVVRARSEIPLSFQVAGRIAERLVDAGQAVTADAPLFRLDPRDIRQQVNVAEAQVRAARVESDNAVADRKRLADLRAAGYVGEQAADNAAAEADAALERLAAAQAALGLASNSLAYGELLAPAAGVLIDVTGEPGQVVGVGQPVAVLAAQGDVEVEVSLPEAMSRRPPPVGRVAIGDDVVAVELREIAGAADPASRTWRARYRVTGPITLALGSVVRVTFEAAGEAGLWVPVGAVDERGAGPAVWIVENGRATPRPVRVLQIGDEFARIAADLPPGASIIALGTHLLQPGQAVRDERR